MHIKSIEWLDSTNQEAILEISDDKDVIICFSHPCNYSIGQIITEPLECLDTIDIAISTRPIFKIERKGIEFNYLLIGKVIDIEKGIVMIGSFILHIDENIIPKDIKNNDYIEFSTSRIDVW